MFPFSRLLSSISKQLFDRRALSAFSRALAVAPLPLPAGATSPGASSGCLPGAAADPLRVGGGASRLELIALPGTGFPPGQSGRAAHVAAPD